MVKLHCGGPTDWAALSSLPFLLLPLLILALSGRGKTERGGGGREDIKQTCVPSCCLPSNVFPLISGGKVALNRSRGLRRFNATFTPDIKGKTLPCLNNFGMAATFVIDKQGPKEALTTAVTLLLEHLVDLDDGDLCLKCVS